MCLNVLMLAKPIKTKMDLAGEVLKPVKPAYARASGILTEFKFVLGSDKYLTSKEPTGENSLKEFFPFLFPRSEQRFA